MRRVLFTLLMVAMAISAFEVEAKKPKQKFPPAKRVSVTDMPVENKRIEVRMEWEGYFISQATIYFDGKLLQTVVPDEDCYLAGPCSDYIVHFVDGNFDGNLDIYLGTGESRTFNSWLIFNLVTHKFDLMEAGQGLVVDKTRKAIYYSGSSSYVEWEAQKCVWQDGGFVVQNYFTSNFAVPSKPVFTLLDADYNVIKVYNSSASLPEEWRDFAMEMLDE